MAQIIEHFTWEETVSWTEPSLTLEYVVIETEDPTEVDDLVNATIPPFVVCAAAETGAGGSGAKVLYLNSWKKDHKGGCWDIQVQYGKDPARKAGKISFQGDSGGGQVHITQSLQTVHAWAIDVNGGSQSPSNFERAIGVNDREVSGCDIPAQGGRFTVTVLYGEEMLRPGYIRSLSRLRGSMNDATCFFTYKGQVFGYAAGELRFEDWHASDPGTDLWEIAYTFNYSPNVTEDDNLHIGGIPAGDDNPRTIEKLGWDFLWIKYRVSGDSRSFLKIPAQVNVERVSKMIDFVDTFLLVFTAGDGGDETVGEGGDVGGGASTGDPPTQWYNGTSTDGSGVPAYLVAEVSYPTGTFASLTNFDFTIVNNDPTTGQHSYTNTFGSPIGGHAGCTLSELGIFPNQPTFQWDDDSGATEPQNFTASPFAATYFYDDGAGNSFTLYVHEQ